MSQLAHSIELQLDLGQKKNEALRYKRSNENATLGDFLRVYPVRTSQPIPQELYGQPLKHFLIVPIILEEGVEGIVPLLADEPVKNKLHDIMDAAYEEDIASPASDLETYPDHLSDNEAVQIAYRHELEAVGRYLQNDLSVLIVCDKILTEHIYDYVCKRAGRIPVLDDSVPVLPDGAPRPMSTHDALGQALGQQRGGAPDLPLLIRSLKENQVLVLRSIDVLDAPPLIETLYQGVNGDKKPQLLGFLDPSLEVKKVLTDRFAIRYSIMGLPRYIQPDPDQPALFTVTRLVTAQEHTRFKDFDSEGLFKNVAGLNAIQFRNAMRYVGATAVANSSSRDIYDVIRRFKTSSSDEIEIPDTGFDDIGGYERVKQELKRIVALTTGHVNGIDERERQKLIPRGFIFHGPPGTGKTLFAKAIASEMHATIQMVSGPEIMDKYVGQSESNLRHIFSTARRNAPSVIFFDEFDSVASQRSTYSDGGSRANNAVVAQLLTELDGFREDQAVLVIGTTNRIDIIDEALLRPSRLRPIEIGQPDYIARRSVASIHAKKFGVDRILRSLCALTLEYLWEWQRQEQIPPAFLQALFTNHPSCKVRYEAQVRTAGFVHELQVLFHLIQDVQQRKQTKDEMDNSVLTQIKEQLLEIGPTYGLDFSQIDLAKPLDSSLQPMQTDLTSMFKLIQDEANPNGSFSPDIFVTNVMDLIAEYTESFNNDEIRAIFQEASLEYHLEGQLITPRYLGMKVGLIRKRRDERQMIHLPGARRR
jgi:transitional endoplasmic reticulum ATPase